jgi:amino acid transporter
MEANPQKHDPKSHSSSKETADIEIGSIHHVHPSGQHLQRKLRSKEVQLFAIGGAIGTSLFVQMGSALPKGGPAGLFLGFIIWGAIMLCINECFGM